MTDEDEFDARIPPPSKSQRKRDALAVQKLGTELLNIPESDWVALELPGQLIAALREARHIHAHGAHKRHLQYIGKLMRDLDPEPIRQHLEQLRLKSRERARAHQELEKWRERLVDEGDSAVEAFLELHRGADRQHLRRLVRQARKEREHARPSAAGRALFRYLRELDGG